MADAEAIIGRSKKQLILAGAALVLVLGLLWALLYSARSLKETLARQNEVQAQETLRTLNQALKTFHEKYDGYPDSLERLRPAQHGHRQESLRAQRLPLPLPPWLSDRSLGRHHAAHQRLPAHRRAHRARRLRQPLLHD
jgi:hypothetical protein